MATLQSSGMDFRLPPIQGPPSRHHLEPTQTEPEEASLAVSGPLGLPGSPAPTELDTASGIEIRERKEPTEARRFLSAVRRFLHSQGKRPASSSEWTIRVRAEFSLEESDMPSKWKRAALKKGGDHLVLRPRSMPNLHTFPSTTRMYFSAPMEHQATSKTSSELQEDE